jgi:hypothetical protein
MNKKLQKFAEFCRILQNFWRQNFCVCVGRSEKTFQNRKLNFLPTLFKFFIIFNGKIFSKI